MLYRSAARGYPVAMTQANSSLILDLLRCWPVDRAASFLIGDKESDCAAASAAGISSHLFRGGNLAHFVSELLKSRAIRESCPPKLPREAEST